MNTKIVLNNKCTIHNAPKAVSKEIAKQMTISNPLYYQALKHGRWSGDILPVLQFYERKGDTVSFPRGFAVNAWKICKEHGIKPEVEDKRLLLPEIDISFKGKLREYQKEASGKMRGFSHGVLQAGTGAGKTVTALDIIAKRRQPTLVLVHTKELLYQWKERAEQFLGIEAGQFGAGKKEIKPVTIGMVQTVKKNADELQKCFGHLVVDECHRTPSTTFSQCIEAFDSKYLLGLTATPIRRDGLAKLIFMSIGDKVHEIDSQELKQTGVILVPEIVSRETTFNFDYKDNYHKMIDSLVNNRERNLMIADDIAGNVNGGTALVASDRVEHLENLAEMIKVDGAVAVLTGKTSQKERKETVEKLSQGKISVLLSTYSLLGEGFDASGLDSLFLASPVKYEGKLIQIIGRVLRPQEGKTARIFDYQDVLQPVLNCQVESRKNLYSKNGYIKAPQTETEGATLSAF